MAALVGILFLCCLSSSGIFGAYTAGIIPGTGPKLINDSGLDTLKKYIPIYDTLTTSKTEAEADEFINTKKETELKNACTDFSKVRTFQNDIPANTTFLTLSGMKPANEIVMESFGEENLIKIEALNRLLKCKLPTGT